jgi:hypothetical protein
MAAKDGASGNHNSGSAGPRLQPWTKPEDRQGWELVARGRGRRNAPPVKTAIMLSLDREQADWLEDTAAAAGLSPEDYLLRLLDDTRQAAQNEEEHAR